MQSATSFDLISSILVLKSSRVSSISERHECSLVTPTEMRGPTSKRSKSQYFLFLLRKTFPSLFELPSKLESYLHSNQDDNNPL